MKDKEPRQQNPATTGSVEPHALLLKVPSAEQSLYKIISIENLLRSIEGNYLHFNRVDRYEDFPGADPRDGRQLPKDQQGNSSVLFEKAPGVSAANVYDQSRARTYACCFSLENSAFIWESYANGSEKGKVGVVFEFGKLRSMLNLTLQSGNAVLEYNGNRCYQIFSVNYGIIKYVDWDTHRANIKHRPNPIIYTYLKDKERFSEEKELSISLSATGIGQFALGDGSKMPFPSSLQLTFNFKAALADGTIQQILCTPDSDSDFLQTELQKLRIVLSKG